MNAAEEMALALGRIEAKVDILVADRVDHGRRIHAIEKKLMYATGVVAAALSYAGIRYGVHV